MMSFSLNLKGEFLMDNTFHRFTIRTDSRFLKQDIQAWYSLDYTNYGNPGNPDWIVDLKTINRNIILMIM